MVYQFPFSCPIHPIPHATITLKGANGSLMEIKGFIRFDLQLGDVNCSIEALVISPLRPDDIFVRQQRYVFVWCKT